MHSVALSYSYFLPKIIKPTNFTSTGTKLPAISVVPPVLNQPPITTFQRKRIVSGAQFHSVCSLTGTTRYCLLHNAFTRVSTASSGVNFRRRARKRACSRRPFLSTHSLSEYSPHHRLWMIFHHSIVCQIFGEKSSVLFGRFYPIAKLRSLSDTEHNKQYYEQIEENLMNRRDLIRMSDEEIHTFLEEQRTLQVATIDHDGIPHL